MAITVDDVRFYAPGLVADDAIIEQAINKSESKRPSCLSEADQDQAQIWYVLWLLSLRSQSENSGIIFSGIVSAKEGDDSVTYGKADKTNGQPDPLGYLALYQALADLCGLGAIIVGRAFPRGCGC